MALLKVLLLLGLGVAVSSVSLQKRVVGGQNCKDDERHYHVMLEGTSTTHTSLCGGSLISDEWILTAAHCWESGPGWTNTALIGVHPKGLHKVETYTITHKEIYRDINNNEHDIMLLKLPKKITTIKPIKLPNCSHILPVGTRVQIAGFGPAITGPNNLRIDHRPSDLQCAEIKILKHGSSTFSSPRYQYEHWSCTKSSTKDTSAGDSGGGWVFNNRLYGVHVRTGDPIYACSAPAYFMDVCGYRKWIDDTIKPPKKTGIKKQLGCLNCG
ncbi:anionic trypsin-2-like isoform X1 [Poecilia latipinna]|uniref:anionic trypsin-2-like isoform X1 n=2 Tax=Poecilia latipinna TaxID=48699 RepID=UPI00072DF39B|nr:PREDICTED: anionic trypsin-2-like isoform X1 [Poecilia latipinna]